MSRTIDVEQHGNVLVATLNNPPYALMNRSMYVELGALVHRANTDPTVGGVVLTGGHPSRFIAHFDVAQILVSATRSPKLPASRLLKMLKVIGVIRRIPGSDAVLNKTPFAGLVALESLRELMLSISCSSAVWVAALNGDTGGGGCELAMACDVRIMADGDFSIAQPEVFLGFPPGAGGTQRLTRLLGPSAAVRVCLDGGPLTPSQALAVGLVDQVVPAAQLLEISTTEASRLGRRPKAAIGAIKRAITIGGSLPLVDGLRFESAEFLGTITTPESIAAQRAYIKRTGELGDLPVGVPTEIERTLERGRFA